jgi:chorismate mutase
VLLERLLGQDVKNLGAIHRGFSSYQKTNTETFPIGKLL